MVAAKSTCAGVMMKQLNAIGSSRSRKHTRKQPDRDGSFHDSGRNAGQDQGLNHRGVGSFHE